MEWVCARQPSGIDCGSQVCLGIGGPLCAIAVGDFALDYAGAELALRGVVGGVDLAGVIAKGQKLVTRAPDFGLQLPGEIASSGRGQNGCELFFQLSLFPREGRRREVSYGAGQVERLCQPNLEPEGQIIRAVLEGEGGVAGQMRKTGLMPHAVLLLGRIETDQSI